jgi:predicted RNA-binding protein YlxR (DUF448 family)
MKKIPLRTCVVTKEKMPKKDLLRIIRSEEGNISIDLTGKSNGHGVYLKKDIDVIAKAQKTKILEKLLNSEIGADKYQEMVDYLNKQ